MSNISTESIAIFSAIISTGVAVGVFALELLRLWQSRPRLHISIQTDMSTCCSPNAGGQGRTFVTITNRGIRPTTITNLYFVKYKTRIDSFLNIRKELFVIPFPQTIGYNTGEVPSSVGSNEQWHGVIIQDKKIESMMENSCLLLSLRVTHCDRLIMSKRVTRHSHCKGDTINLV